MTATENWWAFRAHHTETEYGFGTKADAERWVARLNADREINQYYLDLCGPAELERVFANPDVAVLLEDALDQGGEVTA